MSYIVVSCAALGDQWECDADRQPVAIIDNLADIIPFARGVERSLEVWAPRPEGRGYDPIEYRDLTRLVFNLPELKFHYDKPLTDDQSIKDFVYALYYY